ncbi:MAG TPA: DUF445 domain-containing protein [Alphaproteobacteria bacterium]|nr:DUF445 domain-containing protein [Alphaproteobacteria bacterium]
MSLLTNIISIALIIIGFYSPIYSSQIMNTGFFAFSGAITNWLAIYMLFEKVPFLYGSGVVPNRFEEFKAGIKNLIIKEFFNRQHLEQFFTENNFTDISKKIDLNKIYEGLVDAIMNSQFGGMLAMFGGKKALEPLKEPIERKIQEIITELTQSPEQSGGTIETITQKVEHIIDTRLEKLTPQMVKNIVQEMIEKHLGWLVVWGGVFGGLIGLIFSFI